MKAAVVKLNLIHQLPITLEYEHAERVIAGVLYKIQEKLEPQSEPTARRSRLIAEERTAA